MMKHVVFAVFGSSLFVSGCMITLPLANDLLHKPGYEIIQCTDYTGIEPGSTLEVILKTGETLNGKMVGSHRIDPYFVVDISGHGMTKVNYVEVEQIRKKTSTLQRNRPLLVLGLVVDVVIFQRYWLKQTCFLCGMKLGPL